MSNYESIPVGTRIIIQDHLHLNDNLKNAVGRLWGLYLRVNTYDTENAEGELQNFLNTLQQYIGQPEIMLNAINQKINDVDREINGNDFINKISESWSGAIPATLITKNNKSTQDFIEKKVTYDYLIEKIK